MAQQNEQANVNANIQTIAAPLIFVGNEPPTPNELSPQDFLRQLEIRILGNRIERDEDKLSFALNALQGKSHDWYISCLLYTSDAADE